jgi:RHS repeat-associated protein
VGNLEQIAATGATTTTTTFYYAGSARIALAVNGSFNFLATDGLGSADVALNSNGSAIASELYAPYGAVRYSNGTMPTDYGFTGQHADATTGLDYYNARYYDPVAGQFASADTVLPAGGLDILGLSRYAYVEGNPVVRADPSGNLAESGGGGGSCEPYCGTASASSGYTSPAAITPQPRRQAQVNDWSLDQFTRGVAGFLYEPPEWALAIPGVAEQSLLMHVSEAVPQDLQQALLFAFGAGGFIEAEASVAGLATSVIRTGDAVDESVAAEGSTVLRGNNLSGQVTSRASWRVGTVRGAWEDAEIGPTGGRLCPTCDREVLVEPGTGPRDWDINHGKPWSHRTFPANVIRGEVIDNYQNDTWLECPLCNRSRGAQ